MDLRERGMNDGSQQLVSHLDHSNSLPVSVITSLNEYLYSLLFEIFCMSLRCPLLYEGVCEGYVIGLKRLRVSYVSIFRDFLGFP